MDSKKHRVIYRNKMYWTKKKKKRHHRHSRREDSGKVNERLTHLHFYIVLFLKIWSQV